MKQETGTSTNFYIYRMLNWCKVNANEAKYTLYNYYLRGLDFITTLLLLLHHRYVATEMINEGVLRLTLK